MHKIWIIARHEYGTNVRRVGFILFTTLVPLLGLLTLAIVAVFGGQLGQVLEEQFTSGPQLVGVLDQEGSFTPILPDFRDRFQPYESEAEGRTALRDKEIGLLLIIPRDYVDEGVVRVITALSELETEQAISRASLNTFLVRHLLHGRIAPALELRAASPANIERIALDSDSTEPTGTADLIVGFLVPYFMGTLLVITIFTSSGYLLQGVAEEKSNRVMELMLSSVSAQQMLAGKILGMGALGLTQITVWLVTGAALGGGAWSLLGVAIPALMSGGLLALAVVYYLLGFMIYATLMGIAGALGTTQQESQQLAGIFSLFAAVPMMLSSLVIQSPNATIARVLSWIPLTAPTMMLIRMPMGRTPAVDVVGSLLVTLITIPLMLWAGAKVFRLGLLMYGKRPSVQMIWRAIREA